MNCIWEAAILNNEAVALLASGAPAHAFQTFRNALAILSDLNSHDSLIPTAEPAIAQRSTLLHPTVVSICSESEYATHSRPFIFNLDEIPFSAHLYSAVITYNMALMVHLTSRCSQERAMNNALRLYDVTLSIFNEAPNKSECMSVIMAALNNKARIHHELCQFDEAKEVSQVLLNSIMSVSSEVRSTFDNKDVEEFLLTVMHLNTPAAACAA